MENKNHQQPLINNKYIKKLNFQELLDYWNQLMKIKKQKNIKKHIFNKQTHNNHNKHNNHNNHNKHNYINNQ